MKEKLFNNTIFILFIILLLLFSLKCFLIAFHVVQEDFAVKIISHYLHLLYANVTNQMILALIGFLVFFISIYLIWLKQKRMQEIPSVKVLTDYGEMKISTLSLGQIVLHILSDVEGIRKIDPEIQVPKSGGINAILQLTVSPECNIPHTAQQIQEKLKAKLPGISGIEVKEIRINVNKIDYEKLDENSK